ncbi:hypothetical protein HWV62_35500 [Athelia sp. TMB]|nr:hypothetical protein HWV62_35500 [Athelia sp. TMB]
MTSSPTSTSFDFTESDTSGKPSPRCPSELPDTAPPTPSATRSRHYFAGTLTVFKAEDHVFRINRALLDDEGAAIPEGVGSEDDPIELTYTRAADLEILLDFLSLGTRHDKKSLTSLDWASVMVVGSRFGMQRILGLAQDALSNISRAGAGFETYGMYFLIREKGMGKYLINWHCKNTEGVQLHLCLREKLPDVDKKFQVFFLSRSGALHHAMSGLAVDIIDNVPVLRRERPASGHPNPWSHPLPEFSFVDQQIRVKFLSDPRLPSCTDEFYPDDSWATKNFVLAARTERDFHMHPISDFSPWIPRAVAGFIPYEADGNHAKECRVLVEQRQDDVGGARTSWEIVAATSVV